MPRNNKNALWRKIEGWLDGNTETFSYGQIAEKFNTNARAVGMAMRAIGNNNRPDLCRRVVFKQELP